MRWWLAIAGLAMAVACRSFTPADPAPAAASDAGSSGGSVADANAEAEGGATRSRCSEPNDFLLCEDFDSPNALTSCAGTKGDGTISVSAHAGRPSVVVATTAPGADTSYGLCGFPVRLPSKETRFYARFRMYLDGPLPGSNYYALVSIDNIEIDLVNNALVVNQFNDPVLEGRASTVVPAKQWVCVEWMLEPRATTVWLDTRQVVTRVLLPGEGDFRVTMTEAEIGLNRDHGEANGATIALDDLAIGTSPIGCD